MNTFSVIDEIAEKIFTQNNKTVTYAQKNLVQFLMIHILANCASRKSEPTPKGLRLRTVKASDAKSRAKLWWQKLSDSENKVAAERLYMGEHWSVVRTMVALAAELGLEPKLWIISAGYGLIEASSQIASYSATFQPNHPDTIAANTLEERKYAVQAWWSALGSFPIQDQQTPRTITDLTAKTPDAHVLLVASPEYLLAVEKDLLAARANLASLDQLIIVSSRATTEELSRHLVPSEAALQSKVGGSLLSLHARVALKIITESRDYPLNAALLQRRYQKLIKHAPPPERHNRKKRTDGQVKAFIKNHLTRDEDSAYSPIHRALRDGGFACGEERFKKLFQEVHHEKKR